MSLTVTVPLLVMLSLLNLPVSVVRAMVGAAGGVTSTMMSALFTLGVVVVLPARSVCLTLTVPAV